MKKLLLLPALALGAFALVATTAFSADEPPPPEKVWICHFAGHSVDAFPGGGTILDGDYVINNPTADEPTAGQHAFCDDRGGNLIRVSERAAERGHGAQLLDRIP